MHAFVTGVYQAQGMPGMYSTDKKEIKFSSYTYKEIVKGWVAKSYMTNGLLIYG
jgi:hypothetical protein